MKKVLMIVVTYNPRNNTQNYKVWKRVLVSLLIQRKPDLQVDIAVVDNISHQDGRDILLRWQSQTSGIYLDFIDTRLPVYNCINHALGLLKNNNYDWIGNCSSDIIWTKPDDLSILLSDAELNSDCLTISPQVSTDMNIIFPHHIKFGDYPPTRLKIQESVNGHCYLHSKRFYEAYDYRLNDILWGQGAENIISYCDLAIRGRQYISHRVQLNHIYAAMERQHHGFYDKPYETWGTKAKFIKMIEEGQKIGLGWEEIYFFAKGIKDLPCPAPDSRAHNPDAYGEDGFPKTNELYHYLKKNLFLTKEQLDYDKIPAKFYEPIIKT